MQLSTFMKAAKRLDDEIKGAVKANEADGRRTVSLPFGSVTADVSTGSRKAKDYEGAIDAGNAEIGRLSKLLEKAGVGHQVRLIEVEEVSIPVRNVDVVAEVLDAPTAKRIDALELPLAMALVGLGLDEGKLKRLGLDEKAITKALATAPAAEVAEKV